MKLKVNNITIDYSLKTCDSNKYVLFLHGFGGSKKSFEGVQNALSNSYNTVNLDLPSFGVSSSAPHYFTIFDYAKVVEHFLHKLKIKKVSIVSHSFGGRIAIILTNKHPELIDKLVLINAAGIKPRFNLKIYLKVKYFKVLKLFAKLKLVSKHKLNKFGSKDYKNLSSSDKQVFNNVIKQDLRHLLSDIKAPTLIIWGKKDKTTPIYMAKKINKKVKNSGLIVFKNASHYSYLDQFNRCVIILKEFL
jgi:pimeloyl-ACP methyl ester carboxylesterase